MKDPRLTVESLSVGKYKNNPVLNEDGYVVTQDTFAVIDGSAPRTDIKFLGKSSARFATDILKNVLEVTPSTVNGKALVSAMTETLNKEIENARYKDFIQKNKEASPAALFIAARIVGDKLIVTALGDVSGRINGKVIHEDSFKTEKLMTKKRIAAMQRAKAKNAHISDEELLKIGKEAIASDLVYQVRNYFNNSENNLGLGIINGEDIPEKFIKTYTYKLKDIKTLELFSDGYFVLPKNPEVQDWEEAFFAGEKQDPLHWEKYPAVKAATADKFYDDRTIVIVKHSIFFT